MKMPISNYDYPAKFKQITDRMADTYARKNADYGNSFAMSTERFGLVSGATRIYDKFNRMCELIDPCYEQKVNDESLMDTCIDAACYFIMQAMQIDRMSKDISDRSVGDSP